MNPEFHACLGAASPPATDPFCRALQSTLPAGIVVRSSQSVVWLLGDGTSSTLSLLVALGAAAYTGAWELSVHWDADVHSGVRDPIRFPADDTGDRLWAHAVAGDVQCVERAVTFIVDFPTVTAAGTFVSELDETFPERSHHRVVEQTLDLTFMMVPDHEALSDLEADIEELAAEWGADGMGWEFVPVKELPPGRRSG